jgi:cell division protein FtsL
MAAASVKQERAQLVLEVRNAIAERRLGDAEHRGRLAQAAGLADHANVEQVADVQRLPSISFRSVVIESITGDGSWA